MVGIIKSKFKNVKKLKTIGITSSGIDTQPAPLKHVTAHVITMCAFYH